MTGVSSQQLDQIRSILEKHLKPKSFQAFVFGSRVTGDARPSSDLDLLIKGDREISFKVMALLKDDFEESALPFRVDVVDFYAITDDFREKAMKSSQQLI